MTTYGEMFGDPVAQLRPTVNVYALDDGGGLPITQLSLVLTPEEGLLEIPRGKKGEKGDQGEPARPYIDRGDIANQAAIDVLGLGPGEAGWAFRNLQTNALHYWTGKSWIVHANAYGQRGETGPMGAISDVTVEMLPKDQPASGNVTGPAGSQAINLKIPVQPGPAGPAGTPDAIEKAPDYKADTPAVEGDVLTKRADGKWGPSKSQAIRKYSLPEGNFTGKDSTSADSLQIASMSLDVLPYRTQLDISGHVRVDNGLSAAIVNIEVRLGDPDNGPLIAKGLGLSGWGEKICHIRDHYSGASTPNTFTAPTGPLGVIPANHTGNQGTLYVVAKRVGYGNWGVKTADAQLVVRRVSA